MGELIARLDGPNMNHYHFDQLGSTRLLTNSAGAVTDEYTYDAYGAVLSHNRSTGSIDQPYQYVGQLGYYTHWQEPGFGLRQLGVRYFSPELGQFLQRDSFKMAGFSDYSYGRNSPTRFSDPTGLQALIYPVFEMGGRCSDPHHAPGAAWEIAVAQSYVKYVVQKLGLTRCPARMKVHCYKKIKCKFTRRMNSECGSAGWHSGWNHMHVNFAPQCSRAMCIILHEMIHNCTGSTDGHKLHGQIGIPTCGAGFGSVDPDEDYTLDDPL